MLVFLAFVILVVGENMNALGLEIKTEQGSRDSFIKSRYCDYYNHRPDLSKGPCHSKNELDISGACNTTHKCLDKSHCFMSWRNVSGVIEITNGGCWLKHTNCVDKPECKADSGAASSGVFFCCCAGDYCNRNFYADPTSVMPDPEEGPAEAVTGNALILVEILVPLFGICALVVFGYYCYRKRQYRYDDMERVSVDTPETNVTRCTASSFPTAAEFPLPQFLDVKARGRFGKVWRAQLGDKIVAVKTFNLSEKASWQNEQDIFCTALMNTHANVLKFLGASSRGEGMNSELWLVTEFYEKGSLADYLKVHTVTLADGLRIIRTMASGLSFLHEDIISAARDTKPAIAHRDFKSKNILLDQDLNAVVADFGLAVKFMPGESPGETHGQVGTLRYMAPEVLEGAINFQKDSFLRIDMYAFGLVMWEVLSRCKACGECSAFRMPFEEELGTNPSIERLQEHIVEKNLRPNIKEDWKRDKIISTICVTIDECWDHDAESRLSAGCVELRIAGIQRDRAAACNTALLIVDSRTPVGELQGNLADTATMNECNLQMSVLSDGHNKSTAQPVDGTQATTFTEEQDFNNTKPQLEHDNDHDSGTFAGEDTSLSRDGVTEQLVVHESQDTSPEVRIVDRDIDSASSLLTPAEQKSNV